MVKPATPPQPVTTPQNTRGATQTPAATAKNSEPINRNQPITEVLNGRALGSLGPSCAKYSFVELKLNSTSHHTPIGWLANHCTLRPTTFEATPSATTYTRTSPMPARLFGIEMFT